MYVTSTLRKPIDPDALQTYADWFGLKVRMDRPLPNDEVGFVIEGCGVRLESPGKKGQLWHPGLAYRRIKHGVDALRKVLAIQSGDHVLDCTLGMGHDALAVLYQTVQEQPSFRSFALATILNLAANVVQHTRCSSTCM